MIKKKISAEAPSFDHVRALLMIADEETPSRQRLAEKLHVSTHTIQSIIKGVDLPDMASNNISRRRRLAWVKTLTRISLALEKEPWELLTSVGIERDSDCKRIVQSEIEKRNQRFEIFPETSLALFAKGLLLLIRESEGRGKRLEKALESYIHLCDSIPQRAGQEQLKSGIYCRSCMTTLEAVENQGKSEEFCRWCSDEKGRLLPRKQVLAVMTHWFMEWQSGIDSGEARRRADLYMQSMPAWADSHSR